MRHSISSVILLFLSISIASADNGMINIKSVHDVKTTADRLEAALNSNGMTIFTRINHAEGAQNVGLQLRPTELVIFGNPKVGTPMMLCAQSAGIDLPQKALIWEDGDGQVWFSYNAPAYLSTRHNLTECAKIVQKVSGALGNFAKAATMP
jgi:uncharacterized protein (DUF302 family)